MDSILEQKTTFRYEVLVGDDASTDGTAEIVEEYGIRYPDRIKPVLRKQNLGATKNLADLFRCCRGTYIASCEGDDYWTDRNKLEIQVRFLEKSKDFIACSHEVLLVDEDGKELENQRLRWVSRKRQYGIKDFKGIYLPGHPVTLLFRNIFLNMVSPDTIEEIHPIIADRTIALMLAVRGKIYRLGIRMAAYRQHTDPKRTNVTDRIYGNGKHYLVDYQLTNRLEEYANRVLKTPVRFSGFRWQILVRCTGRVILKPSVEAVSQLIRLYKQHILWIRKERKRRKT